MCLAYEFSLHSLTVDVDENMLELLTALYEVQQWWLPLGMHLGLSHSELYDIELHCHHMPDMLCKWLEGPIEKRNKQFLQDALKQLTPQLVSQVYPPPTSGE